MSNVCAPTRSCHASVRSYPGRCTRANWSLALNGFQNLARAPRGARARRLSGNRACPSSYRLVMRRGISPLVWGAPFSSAIPLPSSRRRRPPPPTTRRRLWGTSPARRGGVVRGYRRAAAHRRAGTARTGPGTSSAGQPRAIGSPSPTLTPATIPAAWPPRRHWCSATTPTWCGCCGVSNPPPSVSACCSPIAADHPRLLASLPRVPIRGPDHTRSSVAHGTNGSVDMHFAVATKRQGGRLVLADGCTVHACHRCANVGEVWRGFTRNAYPAILGSPVALGIFAPARASLFVLPPLTALAPVMRRLRGRRHPNGPLARLSLVATGGQPMPCLAIGHRHGWSWRDVAPQPPGACLLLGVLVNAWYRHRLGAVTWGGRRCRRPRHSAMPAGVLTFPLTLSTPDRP